MLLANICLINWFLLSGWEAEKTRWASWIRRLETHCKFTTCKQLCSRLTSKRRRARTQNKHQQCLTAQDKQATKILSCFLPEILLLMLPCDCSESYGCAVPAPVAEGAEPRTHQRAMDQGRGPKGKKTAFKDVARDSEIQLLTGKTATSVATPLAVAHFQFPLFNA